MVPQKTSLSVSKFTPPRLPGIVYRSRLLKLIEQNKDKKLLLILGQAAQGKSTLAASYVHNLEIPSAWVNLSEEDSDPVNLFYSLVHALQCVLKAVDLSPALSYPSISAIPKLEVHSYREWTNAIFERITVSVQIVLDGLDRLSSDAPSFGFLQVILDGLPQHIHFIFLSREMPPLKIQDLKVKQEALVLTNKELAFTLDEVKEFFREGRGMSFTLGELRRIHRVTEGWIGGLILLAETLERLPDEPRRKYISEDISHKFKREVFQYFDDEILSSQPEPVRDFLIKSSILDSIEQGFVRDFVGMKNADEILQDLARKNLFVQAINAGRKGLFFRYHQLFKDHLRAKFESQKTENEKRALFFKTGSLYEKRGELEDSMKYYLKAKAHEHAASILQQIGMDLLKTGRTTDLSRWLAALPEKSVQDNPWLLFYLCMTRRFTGVRENLSSLPKALASFKEREDIRGQFHALASLLEAIIAAGLRWSHLVQSLDQAETLLESTNPDLFPYARAVLLSQLGYGHTLRGNLRRGFLALKNAFLLSSHLEAPMLQADALSHGIVALTLLGDYSLGDEYSQKLEKLAGDFRLPELQTLSLVTNSLLATFKGDEEKAKKLTELAGEYVERHGLIYYYPIALTYKVFYCVFSEKYTEMDQVGNQLLRMASSMGNLVLAASTTFFLGLNSYRKGELNKAKQLIDRSHSLCSPEETNTQAQWYSSKVIKALISLDLSDDHGNGDGLEEALDFFRKVNNRRFMAETHLASALLKSKQGETDAAARSLAVGFKTAEEVKHNHFLLLSRNHRVKACGLALELEVSEAVDYAVHLLTTRFAPWAGPELERLSKHPNTNISEKAWQIRRAIHQKVTPRLRIETLGGFRVLRGTSPIAEKEWQGKKPRAILKAIVASNSKGVLSEIIMEDVWPDAPFDKVGKNYKVALHRLRKALGPGTDKALGSSYIHIKDDALYLDEDLCEVDTYTFLSLIENGRTKEKEWDIKGALKHYNEAAALYKGDFLPEDLYAPWTELRREELRNAYIALLNRIATLHENKGAMNKAISFYRKAIQISPILEDAYQRLMVLYSNMGKRNEALKVYERCRKALQDELDVKPDQVTVALYEKIVG